MGFSLGHRPRVFLCASKRLDRHRSLILCGPYLSTARWDRRPAWPNIRRMPEATRKAIEKANKAAISEMAIKARMMDYYTRHGMSPFPWPDFLQDAYLENSIPKSTTHNVGCKRVYHNPVRCAISILFRRSNGFRSCPFSLRRQRRSRSQDVKEYQLAFPNAPHGRCPRRIPTFII